MPTFEVLENPVRDTIIRKFLEKKEIINYKEIKALVGEDTSRPDYHLNILVESGFVERTKGRGNYELNKQKIQLLRKRYEILVPICLIGGLGDVSLYANILDSLREVSIIPKEYFLLTSLKVKNKFRKSFSENNIQKKYDVKESFQIFNYETELKGDIIEIKDQAEKIIQKKIIEYEVICELTGGTKLATIALSNLSEKYNLRKITGDQIKWL